MKPDSKIGILQRNAQFEKQTIDEEARTAVIAFSSEEPVPRWDGNEILDHDPKSIRLGRLRDGGPLLVDHDPTDHVGVVESVTIDNDRRGRATVRFGKGARASEVFQDVVDGIRRSISVGYRVYSAVTERNDSDEKTYRVNDWEPLEVSFVSIPADTTAQVGRSSDTTLNNFKIKGKNIMTDSVEQNPVVEQRAAAPQIDIEQVRNEAREQAQKDELDRMRSINAIAAKFEAGDMARQFSESGKSVAEFKDAILEKMGERPAMRSEQTSEIGLQEKDIQRYSILRAVNAMASGDWSKAGLEREVSIAAGDKYGREARGFWLPDEVKARAMTTASDGVGLKGTVTTGYIDKLYDNSLAIMLGADVMTGLVGDLSVPAMTAGSTAYWVAEDGNITEADATIGSVALAPKTVGFAVPISRRLRIQSSPSVDAIIESNIMRELGLAIDHAVLEGGITNGPVGIINTAGVPTSTILAAGSPTRAELIEFETDVAAGNGLNGNLAFVTTSAVRGNMKTTAVDSGSGLFLCSDSNQAIGYDTYVSNQLTANSIIFGNFQDIYVGMWGGSDIVIDDSTKAASGGVVMRVFQDVDVAVKHAASFAINV